MTPPWTAYIRGRVISGPVDYDELVAEASKHVPPGRAYRTAIKDLENLRLRRNGGGRDFSDVEGRKEARIRYGSRSIVASTLHGMKVEGRIKVIADGDSRLVVSGDHPFGSPIPAKPYASDLSKFILYAVADEALSFNDLFQLSMDLIPRDKAIEVTRRKRTSARENQRARGRQPAKTQRPQPSDDDDFRTGCREILNKAVRSLSRSKRIVLDGEGPNRIVAKGPQWVHPDL